MSVNIVIDKNINKILTKLEKESINYLKEKIDEAKPSVTEKTLDLVENKLQTFFDSSVMQFYKYRPEFYKRRGTLYNIFVTERNGSTLNYWFDPTLMPYRNEAAGRENGLYNTVFVEGYHGGAKLGGEYLIPYRHPALEYNGHEVNGHVLPYDGYSVHAWKVAKHETISPLEMFVSLKEDYEKKGFKRDLKQIWIDELKNRGLSIG